MSASAKTVTKKRRKSKIAAVIKNLFGGGRNGDMSLSFFSYVMILLLSGTRLMGVSLKEGAVAYWEESFRSFFEKEGDHSGVSDGFC
ncbi:MAG: hypothetical protein IKC21_04245, partial [Ruminococcus sp.]|nr:hypothetical protein [Ruminococcus sp.]